MKYKIFMFNKNEEISLTKKDLEELLDEAYNDGYLVGLKDCGYCYSTSHTKTL